MQLPIFEAHASGGTAGVQVPIHQDLASPRLETDFTVVLSLRIQF